MEQATKQAKRAKYNGRSKDAEYRTWKSMLRRCHSENDTGYYKYGAKGVRVCERWRGKDGYNNFISDMGHKKPGETIDRIDVYGNYEPNNCRWATIETQANNKRTTRYIEAFGKKLSAQQWAKIFGVNRKTIIWRIEKGWPVDKALTEKRRRGYNGAN